MGDSKCIMALTVQIEIFSQRTYLGNYTQPDHRDEEVLTFTIVSGTTANCCVSILSSPSSDGGAFHALVQEPDMV